VSVGDGAAADVAVADVARLDGDVGRDRHGIPVEIRVVE
jgi:hypothetical protein